MKRTSWSNLMQSAAIRRNKAMAAARRAKVLLAKVPSFQSSFELDEAYERATGYRPRYSSNFLLGDLKKLVLETLPGWIATHVEIARRNQSDWLRYRRWNREARAEEEAETAR